MKNIYLYIVVLLLVMSSCSKTTEEIDWNTKNIPNKLIVEGDITNESGLHPITLRRSDNYFSNSPSPIVSGASVSVQSGTTIIEYAEDLGNPGTYNATQAYSGEMNQEYTLNISLKEELDGVSNYSATSSIIEGMRFDSLTAEIYNNPSQFGDEDSLILALMVYGKEPQQFVNYYMMKLYRNDTLLSDTITDYPTFRDIDNGLNGESFIPIFLTADYSPGDTVTLEFYSIPKDFKFFLDGVNQISQSGDPFGFSGPPANAMGNINEGKALGFFYGASIARARAVVIDKREDF